MGINYSQFHNLVLRPTLEHLSPEIPYTKVAELLVAETIWHESGGLVHLRQWPQGPARGLCQMEEPTFKWLTDWLLKRKPMLNGKIIALVSKSPYGFEEITWNLRFAVAMCRVRYLIVPEALPAIEGGIEERASYWFRYYNASGVGERKAKYIYDAKDLSKLL